MASPTSRIVPTATLQALVETGRFRATTGFAGVANLDTVNVAVPPPLRKTYRYRISGFEYWGLNQWGENTGRRDWANFTRDDTRTTWQRTKWPWGDGWLMYPGDRGEPLSSVRFENLRDGFEDAELLLLLESLGGKAEADRIAGSVAGSLTGYAQDPQALKGARLALLEALVARGKK